MPPESISTPALLPLACPFALLAPALASRNRFGTDFSLDTRKRAVGYSHSENNAKLTPIFGFAAGEAAAADKHIPPHFTSSL
jgi:hypothetical protein